jgi:hypothetical protein
MRKPKPRAPLSVTEVMSARGTTISASSISSLMWQAPSYPVNGIALVIRPTHHAIPLDDQPPRLSKSVKTNCAECCGARYTSGTRRAKKRPTCRIKMIVSR